MMALATSPTAAVTHAVVVADGQALLEGEYAAGVAFASLADAHPGRFEVVVTPIASVCDAWVIHGTTPVDGRRAVV